MQLVKSVRFLKFQPFLKTWIFLTLGGGTLIPKTYSYLIDDGSEEENAKGTKEYIIKRKIKLKNCKSSLDATKFDDKIKYLEKR